MIEDNRYKINVLLFSVLLASFLFGCQSSSDDSGLSEKSEDVFISYIGVFPDEREVIRIGNIIEIDLAEDGSMFLLDQQSSTIYHVGEDGNFRNRIGTPGPGPGELHMPLSISYQGQNVYVFEQAKMQVQEFTSEGEYLDVDMFQGAYEAILATGNKFWLTNHYFQGMTQYTDMPDSDMQPVYTIFDRESGSISHAVEYPATLENESKIGATKSAYHNSKIYTLYRSLLIVDVIDAESMEHKERIYLSGRNFDEAREAVKSDYSDQRITLMDIQVNDFGIFIPEQNRDLTINRFDFRGKHISEIHFAEYYTSEYDDEYIRHFSALKSAPNTLQFNMKVYSDFPRILIFEKVMDDLTDEVAFQSSIINPLPGSGSVDETHGSDHKSLSP